MRGQRACVASLSVCGWLYLSAVVFMCWCAASVTVVRQALEQQLLGLQTSYDQIETKFNHVNKQLSTQRAATVISNRFLRNKLQVTTSIVPSIPTNGFATAQ